jgi:hypothetical protein
VRLGKINRADALKIYGTDPHIEPELIEYTKKRLGFSDEEFNRLMKLPTKCYKDFKTYKQTFETMRPLFYLLAKANLVPMSFYIKYTSKNEI